MGKTIRQRPAADRTVKGIQGRRPLPRFAVIR